MGVFTHAELCAPRVAGTKPGTHKLNYILPRQQWHTIEKPSVALKAKNICPCHPAEGGNPSPACCNHSSTVKPRGGKLKQERGSAYLPNRFLLRHASNPALQDAAAVHLRCL
uniref:Uncharacterized protein n=1 Tax=Pavo cristatus TaxID=9049 RepID=A0A8C9G075_PAVCR